jgi:NADH:ubiquinone oxidoreductase subunit E
MMAVGTDKKFKSAAELRAHREKLVAEHDKQRHIVTVCAGTGCVAKGSLKVSSSRSRAVTASARTAL